MAKSKYADLDKDTLVAAVKDRRAAGRKIAVDLRASEEKLAAALDADDMENGDFDPDAPTSDDATELTPEALRLGAAARADGIVTRQVPDDLNEYKGQYRYLATGEIFGLKILPDGEVRGHKTHHAKSPLKFGDYTADEFRLQFEKV